MVGLTKDELKNAYSEAESTAKQWFKPFNEYERIAANKIREDLPANIPRVNDGSLAALMQETPMRVLAQMPTGKVVSKDRDEAWLTELANIIWSKKVIPNASTQAPFFSKLQIAQYRSLIYGSQPIFSFFLVRGDYRGADFVVPYIRDVFLEPGKISDKDSDHVFMNTYYTKLQLKNIIEQARDEDKAAKKEKRDSTNLWDVSALEEVLAKDPEGKESSSQNVAEREKGMQNSKPYKFVTCFQRGVKSKFYTFAPNHSYKVVRTEENPDPTGDIPIHFLYAFEDLTNPYGKGQVELSGGRQNILDYVTQLHILGTQIGLQPPIKIGGPRDNVNLKSLTYSPNAFWMVGDAQVEIQQTAATVYNQFPTVYGLYKSQLMNMQGTTATEISAESGNPGYSKTPKGIEALQQRTNSHDNFLQSQFHYFFNCLASSMVNITLNNMQGTEIMKLVDDEAEKMMKTGLIDEDPKTKAPSTNEIEVIWENMRGSFQFEVDPSSSIVKDDDAQKERLLEIATFATENQALIPALEASGYRLEIGELFKRVLTKSGVDDWEKVLTPMETPGGLEPGMEGMPAPIEPELPMQPPQPDPQADLIRVMEQYGVDETDAQAVLAAEGQGFDPQEIAEYLRRRQAA